MELVLVCYFLILKEVISFDQIKILKIVLQNSTKTTVLLIKHKKISERDWYLSFFFFLQSCLLVWWNLNKDRPFSGLNVAKPKPMWSLPSLPKAVLYSIPSSTHPVALQTVVFHHAPMNGLAIVRTFFLTSEKNFFLLEHKPTFSISISFWQFKTFG